MIRQSSMLTAYVSECRSLEKMGAAEGRDKPDSQYFATVSASLYNLLPKLPVADYQAAVARIRTAERLATVDQRHFNAIIPALELTGEPVDPAAGPAIYCSYHLGPYRVAVPYLVNCGVPLTVVTDKGVQKQQGDVFKKLMRQFCDDHEIPIENCQWRDTSEGSLLLSLVRDLRQGRSVFFYIDGNTSVNDTVSARQKNTLLVPFMGASIFARAGVATLSHLAKCRIVPIIMRRNLASAKCVTADIKQPFVVESSDRAAHNRHATAWMWSILETELNCDPFSWEPWRYVHRFLDLEPIEKAERDDPVEPSLFNNEASLAFDDRRFAMGGYADENYLFDRKLYKFYPISRKFRAALEQASRTGVAAKALGPHITNRLITMRALITNGS